MKITGILWLRDIVDKLAWKHNVSTGEVDEALGSSGVRFRLLEKGDVQGENLYAAMGRTDAGRYLVILFVHKASGEALVISARDMTRKERRTYGKR
ncbi:MAG: BrnT family toxin [Candidatus Sumerlaeota bacterium]|nr:BrnT family toxin [Candidatus Sumerlaeota bacterium]